MNKSLLIPHIKDLDTLTLQTVSSALEEKGVRGSIDSLLDGKNYPYRPLTIVNIAHSGTALYIDFFVRSNYLRAENYKNNSPVWDDSSVSFFVCPNAGNEYWNFHFNCIGTVYAAHRTSRTPKFLLSDDEIRRIERVSSCGNKPFRELEGLFAWNVVVKIPFDLIGINYTGTPIIMKGNFCKSASSTFQPHFLTWNPGGDPDLGFHDPASFGDLILQ